MTYTFSEMVLFIPFSTQFWNFSTLWPLSTSSLLMVKTSFKLWNVQHGLLFPAFTNYNSEISSEFFLLILAHFSHWYHYIVLARETFWGTSNKCFPDKTVMFFFAIGGYIMDSQKNINYGYETDWQPARIASQGTNCQLPGCPLVVLGGTAGGDVHRPGWPRA